MELFNTQGVIESMQLINIELFTSRFPLFSRADNRARSSHHGTILANVRVDPVGVLHVLEKGLRRLYARPRRQVFNSLLERQFLHFVFLCKQKTWGMGTSRCCNSENEVKAIRYT